MPGGSSSSGTSTSSGSVQLTKSSLTARPMRLILFPSCTDGRAYATYLPWFSSHPNSICESLDLWMTGLPAYFVQRSPSGEKATETPSPMFGVPAGSRASKKSDL